MKGSAMVFGVAQYGMNLWFGGMFDLDSLTSEEADAMSPAHVSSKQSLIFYAAAVVCRVNRMPCG